MNKRLVALSLILLSLFLFMWPSYISAMVYQDCVEADGCEACYYSREVEFFPLACFVQQPCKTLVNAERSNARMEIIRCLCEREPRDDQRILEVFNQSYVGTNYPDSDKVSADLLCSETDAFLYYYVVYQ